MQETINNHLIT